MSVKSCESVDVAAYDFHGGRVLHWQKRTRIDGLALAEQERVLSPLCLATIEHQRLHYRE